MSTGWICLHRVLKENPRYRNSAWVHVWVDLLLGATHTERPVLFAGRRITLGPGQLITGRNSIAGRTGLNESTIQRILKTMEIEQQIDQETSNTNRLITIRNWQAYQWIAQPQNIRQTTPGHLVNTNNTENTANNENTPPAGDVVHRILVECPKLRALDTEQDLLVRNEFESTAHSLDWEKLAKCTVAEALLMTEPIRNPAMFWRRQIEKQVSKKSPSPAGTLGETATDRLAREFIQ